MAQRFSKPFYKSKTWQQTRAYILMRDNYLCQVCGRPAQEIHHKVKLTPQNINDTSISLSELNLISLCRDCHFKEHEADRHEVSDAAEGYCFDDDGNIIRA